ncbi:MAG: cytochrome P450 [Mycobacteriaceae bacterium]|nr:cytochrome P450 [Mycobacteriaceae bacterium]
MATTVYDPFDADFQVDPYPAYQALRDAGPVHLHIGEPEFYALPRFADVWQAARDPATFSSAHGLTFYPDEIATLGLAPTIVMLDPPRHTALRRRISHGFTPKRIVAMEPLIREFVRGRVDAIERRVADGEPVDLHRDFSSPIPTFVLAHLLGVPPADRAKFDPWVTALTRLQDGGFSLDALQADGAVQAVGEMFAYFGDLITVRRGSPGDDLISALTGAEVDGERLTDWDILGFCFVMVAGGNDTTGNLISHGVALLDEYPDQRARLLAEPELLPGAILEFLRMEGSVQALARTTTRAVAIGDTEIPAGRKVMLMYGSANRDEREFGDTADRLDIAREISRHLGFAGGPHLCIGSHLARLQARIAFEELLWRQPAIGVDTAAAARLPSAFTRGWTALPATGIRPTRVSV